MTIQLNHVAPPQTGIQVHIHYGRRRFLRANGRDLTAQGIYLEVHNLTLPAGTFIELEFHGLGDDSLIEAVVAHQDNTGILVRFVDQQPTLSPMLCYLDHFAALAPPPPSATLPADYRYAL